MKKKINISIVLATIICLLPIILAVALYPQLPKELPIHFNMSGQADNYLPKAVVCFVFPFIFALLNIFVYFMLDSDPKKANSSQAIKTVSMWLIPILSVIFIPMSLFISLGKNIPIHIVVPAFVGVLIIVCGNYLPKSRQNYTVGIKLPWTLNNEENWNKTHRMAGVLWMLCGVVIIITSFLQVSAVPILLIVVATLAIVPTIYSYVLHRRGL